MPSGPGRVRQQPHPPRPCPGSGARPSFRDGGSLGLPSIRGAGAGLGTPGRVRSGDANVRANTENLGRWAGCTQAGPSGRPREVRASPRRGRAGVREPPTPHKHRPRAGGLCPSRLPRIMTKAARRRGSPSGPSTRTPDASREKAAVRHGTELSKEDVLFSSFYGNVTNNGN